MYLHVKRRVARPCSCHSGGQDPDLYTAGVRILVIGGTRFIGPHVVRMLAAEHEVIVYHRGEHAGLLPGNVREVRSPHAGMPVRSFPPELTRPPTADLDAVVHMIPMGEADARAAVLAFLERAARLVALSSGDVYRAWGRFTGLEPGPLEPMPLSESAPLRSILYPYRARARSPEQLEHDYEKILVEREVLGQPSLRAIVLRLPKVYGPAGGDNQDLATVRAFHRHPSWRWTHGYVENVAAAIALATVHPDAAGVYNVGEEHTPTVAQRLAQLPAAEAPPEPEGPRGAFNFDQDIVYDTSRIRRELGYREPVEYHEGLRRTVREVAK